MIGVFDSGYGGLTVLKDLLNRLPAYDYLYLGDNARAPYGARSSDVIYDFTLQGIRWLFESGCVVVVVACNTASARALRPLQQQYLLTHFRDRRLLGVIRPSAEALACIPVGDVSSLPQSGITGKVGILGTRETVRSESFLLELAKLAPNLEVYQQECPLWAPLVENGELTGAGTEWFVQRDLGALLSQSRSLDRILLACTHYAALGPIIRHYLPAEIEVLTQPPIVAERLADWLVRHPEYETRLGKGSGRTFVTTDDAGSFADIGQRILGIEIQCEKVSVSETALP